MNIDRETLAAHLQRISCRGQIKEAVFHDGMAANALTADHLLLVVAPDVDGATGKLPGEIGVADIDLLLRTVRSTFAPWDDDEDETLSLNMTEHQRLIVSKPDRPDFFMLTAEPRTIATRVAGDVVKQIMEQVGTAPVPLSRRLIGEITKWFIDIKADELELHVGPSGGMIRVGGDNTHQAGLLVPELTSKTPYVLPFGPHFIAVLMTVATDTATLYLAGPKKNIMIEDGGYVYMVSPIARPADYKPPVNAAPAAQPKPKTKRKKKTTEPVTADV